MQFEVMKKSYKKKVVIGVSVFIAVIGVFLVKSSFARYQTVKSFKIAEGVINYTYNPADFEIIAMYKQKEESNCTEDNCYEEIAGRMPSSEYVINESKSYCMIDKAEDTQAKLFTNDDGQHIIDNLIKNDKCYLYFDKKQCNGSACRTILANVIIKTGTPNFSETATTDEGVFKAEDDDGISYYYRGAVENNYVKFANKYWRIIRINGDGSIRMIYDGESARPNGIAMTVETSKFNLNTSNNIYVGFKYTSGQAHGTGTSSTILGTLNTWFKNNLTSYINKLDGNAGFCGDRTLSTSYTSINNTVATGTDTTYYGAYIRLLNSIKSPVLTCPDEDFYTVSGGIKGNTSLTYPIGLISADEAAMAGGVNGTANSNYYLYTGQMYWTMSPYRYYASDKLAYVFIVYSDGSFQVPYGIHVGREINPPGVRPVINLRRDVMLTGVGTMSDPYVVQ